MPTSGSKEVCSKRQWGLHGGREVSGGGEEHMVAE